MALVDEDPYGKSERTISAGPKRGKIQAALVSVSRTRRKTGSAPSGFFYFVLLYSVILGLRPCWGADMRGRIFSNIFWCSGWCGSGFSAGGRGFRPPPFSASSPVSCLGLSNTTDWYVKPRGCSCQVGCERKNRYRIPAWFGFLPFLDPQKSFFQVRIRIRILFVWSWNCPVADFNGNMI